MHNVTKSMYVRKSICNSLKKTQGRQGTQGAQGIQRTQGTERANGSKELQ